jgi:hypothetical protein
VALPRPEPGLVISFDYLWRRELEGGLEHGRYPRPCAIVLAVRQPAGGDLAVLVAPITTKPPLASQPAIEIPAAVKRHLGLDMDVDSWAIVDEVNEFLWPGFDLAPDGQGRLVYGFLPPKLYDRVRRGVLDAAKAGRLSRVPR